MANNDRDRRLLDASVLNGAIDALSKVKEEQRIEFIHDRMMSAIDDICKTHQGVGKEKFTAAQIVILKDIVFHVIYVLDTRNRPSRGFFKRLLEEFRAQTPIKQIGIAFAVITVLAGAGVSIVGGYKIWLVPPLEYLNLISRSPEAKVAQPAQSPKETAAPTTQSPSRGTPATNLSNDPMGGPLNPWAAPPTRPPALQNPLGK
jgi:hypothetical protein